MKAMVILVVRDEEETIGAIVRDLYKAENRIELLLVDDGSKDHTIADARRVGWERSADVQLLLHDHPIGVGASLLDGYRQALAQGMRYVIEFPSDGSIPASALSDLLAAVSDSDLVIGSRLTKGGRVRAGGFFRRLGLRVGSFTIRRALRLPIKDPASRVRCWRREVLEAINLDAVDLDAGDFGKLSATGTSFRLESLWRARMKGFKVVEVAVVEEATEVRHLDSFPARFFGVIGTLRRLRAIRRHHQS